MQEFQTAMESRDLDGVVALLADDVAFRSPEVYAPYRGPAHVRPLLAAVGEVLEDFHFTRHIGAPEAADQAFVFEARVGDREVEGCDFIHTNAEGLIDEFYVMCRPFSGLTAFAEAMKRQLDHACAR